MFDLDYYKAHDSSLGKAKVSLLWHFYEIGWKKMYNPSRDFDVKRYCEENVESLKGNNPLVHYICGSLKNAKNSLWICDNVMLINDSDYFDHCYYERESGFRFPNRLRAIENYFNYGWRLQIDPSIRFDAEYYSIKYAHLVPNDICHLVYYLKFGKAQGHFANKDEENIYEICASKLFDYGYVRKCLGSGSDDYDVIAKFYNEGYLYNVEPYLGYETFQDFKEKEDNDCYSGVAFIWGKYLNKFIEACRLSDRRENESYGLKVGINYSAEMYPHCSKESWLLQYAYLRNRFNIKLETTKYEIECLTNKLREKDSLVNHLRNGQFQLVESNCYNEIINAKNREICKLKEVIESRGVDLRFHEKIRSVLMNRVSFNFRLGVLDQYVGKYVVWDKLRAEPTDETSTKFLIVTPSYNQDIYLKDTLESVLKQDAENVLYVVMDGGSEDRSRGIIEGFSDRLLHWESTPDKGQADAINKGFVKGIDMIDNNDIMAWINSDDIYAPGALKLVEDFFSKNPDVDVVYGNRIIINAEGKEIGRWFLPAHSDVDLDWVDYIPQETLFWRKRLWKRVGGIDTSFHFALDWDLLQRFKNAGAKIVRLPYFLGAFRNHGEQKTMGLAETKGKEEMERIRNRVLGENYSKTELARRLKDMKYRSWRCVVIASLFGLRI